MSLYETGLLHLPFGQKSNTATTTFIRQTMFHIILFSVVSYIPTPHASRTFLTETRMTLANKPTETRKQQ